ncbi:MAG: hypothetical protein ABI700_16335 [Chloroflexota bacterium]
MTDENLAQIRDKELMKLYEISSLGGITKRAKQVRTELERRGYLFDDIYREFITCEQWNTRHSDAPIDCAEHATKLRRR